MILSKEDRMKLNYLANGEGAEAVEYLAKILYEYYAREAVYTDNKQESSGAAKLAEWLKTLPKGLRNGVNATLSAAS